MVNGKLEAREVRLVVSLKSHSRGMDLLNFAYIPVCLPPPAFLPFSFNGKRKAGVKLTCLVGMNEIWMFGLKPPDLLFYG